MCVVFLPNGTHLVNPTLDEVLKVSREAGYRKFRLLEENRPLNVSDLSSSEDKSVLWLDPVFGVYEPDATTAFDIILSCSCQGCCRLRFPG